MEADLARWYHIDYRDRWRGDLTLRRLYVLLRHLPAESAVMAVMRAGRSHWSIEAQLLDDLRISLTGSKERPSKPHPQRPRPQAKTSSPERERKVQDARRRARDRRRLIDAGVLT